MPFSRSLSMLVMAMPLPGCPVPPSAAKVLFETNADLGVAPGGPGSPKLSVTGAAEETGEGTAARSEGKYPTLVGASANDAAKVLGLAAVRLMAASPKLVVENA